MRCPFCGSPQTHVLETRDAGDALRRRRACGACPQRFTTYERVDTLALSVRKRDGRHEPFDREKLLRGLVRAGAKRPLTIEQLETVVDGVSGELGTAGGELGTDRIGEIVLGALRGLDPVAYVRFASVYRKFEDAGQFAAELERFGRDSVRSQADDAELPPVTPRDAAKPLEIAAQGEEKVDGA